MQSLVDTAYVRNDVRKAQEWYMLDDSKSTVISKSVVYASSEDAYLLWYMRH